MEGLMLLLDAVAVVMLVYWVMANDGNADKVASKGLFAFVASVTKEAEPAKRPSFRPNQVPPRRPPPRRDP